MRKHAAILLLALSTLSTLALAQNQRGPSTPKERDRALEIAQKLEADPLSPALQGDRDWLLVWVMEVPDISVQMCIANMPYDKHYKRAPELTAVDLAATTAFVIQHPDKMMDPPAAGLAALESMIHAYQVVVKQDPTARSPEMDEVIELQKQGKLADYLNERWKTMCQ